MTQFINQIVVLHQYLWQLHDKEKCLIQLKTDAANISNVELEEINKVLDETAIECQKTITAMTVLKGVK